MIENYIDFEFETAMPVFTDSCFDVRSFKVDVLSEFGPLYSADCKFY